MRKTPDYRSLPAEVCPGPRAHRSALRAAAVARCLEQSGVVLTAPFSSPILRLPGHEPASIRAIHAHETGFLAAGISRRTLGAGHRPGNGLRGSGGLRARLPSIRRPIPQQLSRTAGLERMAVPVSPLP